MTGVARTPLRAGRLAAVPALLFALLATGAHAQTPEPNGAGVRSGVLPLKWQVSGPVCTGESKFEVAPYNEDLYLLRESGCSNYEKPFVFLLFGADRVLLLDTGAGKSDIVAAVSGVIEGWLGRHGRESIDLVVAHTHAHGDHTSGDEDFRKRPRTRVLDTTPAAVADFFGFHHWPDDTVTYDLGGRILDVIAIPGHEPSSIAIYDRQTGVLFTGDTLYPGRLYVRDAPAFAKSVARLVEFTRGKVVAHLLGNHIEEARTPYLDYPVGTVHQPDEHVLELGRGQLLELDAALREMNGTLRRMALRDFTIWPK